MAAEQKLRDALCDRLYELGACDVGFCRPDDTPEGLPYAVSIAVRLSDAIVDEIDTAPTHTYFHHYRSVNTLIDQILLQASILLQRAGFRYLPVAASQSINLQGWEYHGRYSHKKAACLAGMGTIGRSSLFLHRNYGPRVRLGTIFTDCPLGESFLPTPSPCVDCSLCVQSCPAKAILGPLWAPGIRREELFLPDQCSTYMKQAFQHIGRGAVCGICMKVCPYGTENKIGGDSL